MNFWDFKVWGFINLVAVLLLALLVANILKKYSKVLRDSLIPTSVLGGLILLAIATVYKAVSGETMFDRGMFNFNGQGALEIVTYHCLALGFITMTFSSKKAKAGKERSREIFNSGVTTVSTYLLQGILGISITIVAAKFVSGLIPAAGIILPFGYGQGTGQAMNYGNIYENDYGFFGGKNFGLSIAALGFLSASIGGVVHLNILKKRGQLKVVEGPTFGQKEDDPDEAPFMNGGLDGITIQFAAIFITYSLAYAVVYVLGNLVPSLKSVLYGFNFLLGVLMATLIKVVLKVLQKGRLFKNWYIDSKLMDKLGSLFFDLMIVAGIAAIQLELLLEYWHILLLLGVVGLFSTYWYNLFVAKKLFPAYAQEQFLVMYGMLTGTASTGIILLRELDRDFATPAADNLVYQNFPAIVFGFPMMLIAARAPKQPVQTLLILVVFFVVMNVILFRQRIFGGLRRKK